MAGNIFDDALEDLDEQQPAAAKPAVPASSFDDFLKETLGSRETGMRRSVLQSADVDPETAAEARRIALRTGVPADVVQRNIDKYRKQEQLEKPYAAMQGETPKLASWIETPGNLAVVKDDLENLGLLEWLVTAPQRAFASQINQQRYSELRFRELMGETLTQADHDLQASYRYQAEADRATGNGSSWFRKAITGTASFLANQAPMVQYGVAGAAEGGVVGAGVGAIAGPGAIAGAVAGATYGGRAGLLYGVLKSTLQQESAGAYDEYLNFRDEFGRPLDAQVARLAALATGAINAPIEAGAQEFLLRSIPGFSKLTTAQVRASVATALRSPTVRAALLDAAKSYTKTVGAETAQEVLQRGVTILAGELAKGFENTRDRTERTTLSPADEQTFQQWAKANNITDVNRGVYDYRGFWSDPEALAAWKPGEHFPDTYKTHAHPTFSVESKYSRGQQDGGRWEGETFIAPSGERVNMLDPTAAAAWEAKAEKTGAGPFAMRSAGDITADLVKEGTEAFMSFSLAVLPFPLLGGVQGVQRARAAQAKVQLFTALGEGVAQSKTMARMPEAVQAFVEHATKDGPLERVYAPIETWTQYWQEKGQDPAAIATEVTGSRDAYEQAVQTGEDLEIPTARYATKLAGTEHNAYFAQELRLQPGEMNGREAKAYLEQLQQETTAAAAAPAEPAAPVSPIRQALVAQLGEAGISATTADTYARLHESVLANLADILQVEPTALAARYNLEVAREGQTATEAAIVAQAGAVSPGAPVAATPEATEQAKFEALTAPLTPEEVAQLDRRKTQRAEAPGGIDRRAANVIDPGAALTGNEAALAEMAGEAAGMPVGAGGGQQTLRELLRDPTLATRGAEMRRTAMAKPRGAAAVDTGTTAEQTTADVTGADAARAETGTGGRSAYRRIEKSTPLKSRESGRQRDTRRTEHYAEIFGQVLAAAQTLNPAVDAAALRQDFDRRVEMIESLDAEFESSGENLRTLLEAIAALGGIGATDVVSVPVAGSFRNVRKYSGELARLRESEALGPFGSFAGVRGVFQAHTVEHGTGTVQTGLPFELMLTELQNDGRFPYLETLDDLHDALEDAARLGGMGVGAKGAVTFPGTEELRRRAGIDPRFTWWVPGTTYAQGLFDEEDVVPQTTSEQQPAIPGLEAVREAETPTPEFEAPFALTSEVSQRKSKQDTLFQAARASITFGANRKVEITLFANADLSSLLHEFGHLYLEMFTDAANEILRRPEAEHTERQRQLLTDHATLLDFLQEEGFGRGGGFSVAQHEKFARAFEAYLMKGEAPSIELRSAFARFRAWLVGIYRHVKNLNVTIDPRIARVMDRLVATDDAIALAQSQGSMTPIFLDAAAAGMSAREFALYRSTIEDASRRAQETLQTKLLAEVQREQEATYQARREDVRADVEADVHQRREFVALAAIQRGTRPDGQPLAGAEEPAPMKLSRAAIVAEFGAARLKTLPRPYVYTTEEGGLDPSAAAELFGFSSGDELLTALATAGRMDVAIEAETDRRMIAEHGSILLDGTLAERAQAAVANESRDKVIRAEMKALVNLRRTVRPHVVSATQQAKREQEYERRWLEAETKLRIAIAEGRKQVEIDALADEVDRLKHQAASGPAILKAAIPPASVITTAAQARIGAMRVREIRPERFWAAARKASQTAIARAAAQDFDGAIQAQQQQLLNLALYREAEASLDDIEKRVREAKRLGTPAGRARVGKAGDTFLVQIDAILDRYEFIDIPRDRRVIRADLKHWIAAMEGEGLSVELPDEILNEARRENYTELTYDELVGVTDGLKQIAHLARLTLRRLQSAAAEDYRETRDAIVTAIEASGAARPAKLEVLPKDRPARLVGEWFASHTKLSQFVAALDGYVDGGPVWDAIMRPVNEAATRQQAMHETAAVAMKGILTSHYTGRELARFHDQLFIPAIGGSLSREARLAVALNWGNEGNRQRLMESGTRKWNERQVQAILDTLDERDLRFVQASLDYINSYWSEIAAKQKRVFGLAPEKIEPTSWTHGILGEQKGGYYPIAYDGRLSVHQGNIIDADVSGLQKHANYAYATTKRGYTKAREERVNQPIRLELSVMFEHVEAVIHDLTHHEMLIDVGRLLADRKVQTAIASRQGDLVYKQIRGTMLDVALGLRHSTTVQDRAINWVKNGTTIAGLGWNVWTSLQQPLGVFNAMARIGPTWVARGIGRVFRDASSMEWSARWVNEKSEMMRLRGSTLTREIADLRATLKRSGSWFDNALRSVTNDALEQDDITSSFLFLIEKAQQLADLPTWIGGYEKAMAGGETEARAIAMADQGVLDSQSGGQIKDLAQVQRGAPVFRLFTTFYSYGNLLFNQTAREIGRFKQTGSVGQMLGNLALIYVAPAALTAALSFAVGKDDPEDDSFVEVLGRELLASMLNTMVLVRELSGAGQMAYAKATGTRPTGGTRGYEGPTGLRVVSSIGRLVQQAQQGVADRPLLRAAEDVAGVLFHLPLAQVQRSIDGFVALQEGRTTNPAALLVGAPPPKKASGQ